MNCQDKKQRHDYIDFLRVAAILLMFIYHVNMIFVSEWGWHIKNSSRSNVLMEINYWMAFFRMPLLFFVSGFVSSALLERLSTGRFIAQRFNRLIVPTVIWTFLLVAPQIYLESRLQGVELSYFEFYKTFLDFEWKPNGNFHWLHLWFIPYLFLYNLISIPLCRVLQKYRGSDQMLVSAHRTPYLICVFVIFAIIPYTILSLGYPVTYDLIHDYARHAQFIPFVVAGLFAYNNLSVMQVLVSKRQLLLRLAVLSIIIINAIRWNGLEPKNIWEDWLNHPISYGYLFLLSLNSWLWVFALLGYAKRYLNRRSKALTYCNNAVYPFYILHQTVIVVLGYYVVQTQDDDAFKYLFILIVGFCVTACIYHLYIKPFKFMRFAFGVK